MFFWSSVLAIFQRRPFPYKKNADFQSWGSHVNVFLVFWAWVLNKYFRGLIFKGPIWQLSTLWAFWDSVSDFTMGLLLDLFGVSNLGPNNNIAQRISFFGRTKPAETVLRDERRLRCRAISFSPFTLFLLQHLVKFFSSLQKADLRDAIHIRRAISLQNKP